MQKIVSMKKIIGLVALFLLAVVGYAQTLKDLEDLYGKGSYDEVIRLSPDVLKSNPNDPAVNLLVGRVYAETNKFNDAVPYLKTAITNDRPGSWVKAWSMAYLGKCYFAFGQYKESTECINGCISMNATKNATRSASNAALLFGFDKDYDRWTTRETEHIIFHFQPLSLKDINDIDAYMQKRETAFQNINACFGSILPKKIDFFVWHSREDMKAILGSPGGFARPEYCVVHACYDQTPGHEMTHVISNYLPGIGQKTVLINEGTAVYFNQTKADQMDLARKAIKSNGITAVCLKETWNERTLPEEVLYPVGGAFIKYLVENYGKEKFLELFRNQTYENALKVYGEGFESSIETFEKSLFQ
jgi:tetratricopeptide (TPR) repeat protein